MQSVVWGWRGRNFSRVLSSRSSPTRGEETSSPQEAQALPAQTQTPPPPLAKSEISRGFAETISPEKCFRKTESVLYSCFRPFPFGKALCFAQRCESATDARLVRIRILFVIGSDFVNDTPPNETLSELRISL